jgi:cell fate (sporulation/competence/biofilm development) regulator YlbF (YheA/YmcA/DUF963 family)
MVYECAKRLAAELRSSEEYRSYSVAKEKALENDATKTLLEEYHRLQMRAQAATVAGEPNAELLEKLQRIGEVLLFDAAASAYIMSEFRIKRMLADVYKILAEAVGVDLGALEA